MSLQRRLYALTLCCALFPASAHADNYSISIGEPLVGTSPPPGRVGLGVKVDVDKSWSELNKDEQLAWRSYTELTDEDVTPPFPVPHIRGFLRKLVTPEKFNTTDSIHSTSRILLVVRVSELGVVSKVELMEGADKVGKTLTNGEKLLAYRYVRALLSTRFSPALLKGSPVASAFPMEVSEVVLLR